MVPKSGDLEILFDGDGVSGSPEADRGLPVMSRVVLGGVVGVFSTMMDGIAGATERPWFHFFRQDKKQTLFANTT